MYLSLLLQKDKELLAAIRYFLIRYLYKYDSSSPLVNVKQLGREFQVSDGIVSKSINFLVAHELLNKNEEISGRGRPKTKLSIGSRLQAILDSQSQAYVEHTLAIERLLGVVEWADPKGDGKLSTDSKLLLATLLAISDSNGEVEGISLAGLGALSGLSEVQVRANVKRLLAAGYITSYFSGAALKGVAGRQKGKYTLCLKRFEDQLPLPLFFHTSAWSFLRVVMELVAAPSAINEQALADLESRFFNKGDYAAEVCPAQDRGRLLYSVSVSAGFFQKLKEQPGELFSFICVVAGEAITNSLVSQGRYSVDAYIQSKIEEYLRCVSNIQNPEVAYILHLAVSYLYRDVNRLLKGDVINKVVECVIHFDEGKDLTTVTLKIEK